MQIFIRAENQGQTTLFRKRCSEKRGLSLVLVSS